MKREKQIYKVLKTLYFQIFRSLCPRQKGRGIFDAYGLVLCQILGFLSITLMSTEGLAAKVQGELSRVGDVTHFELSGMQTWSYQVKRHEGGKMISLNVQPLDEATVSQLRSWSGPLVQSVEVIKSDIDGKYRVNFLLSEKGIEAFEYQTDQPSRLIVDFYKLTKEEKEIVERTKLENKIAAQDSNLYDKDELKRLFEEKKKQKKRARKRVAKNSRKKRREGALAISESDLARYPANDYIKIKEAKLKFAQSSIGKEQRNGIFDGADPDFNRFKIQDYEVKEEAIIASRQNIYLPFPRVKKPFPQLEELQKKTPVYQILPTDQQENKEARLLLTLFKRKRNGVFLKTHKYFKEKYPKSKYHELLSFMVAETYYRLWEAKKTRGRHEIAMTYYRKALESYPKSPAAEHALLFMGFSYLNSKQVFGALKSFEEYLRKYPNSKRRHDINIAISNALLTLNKYKESLAYIRKVENNESDMDAAIEASYRKGDIFFKKKDFAKAFLAYQEAITKYPNKWFPFPNAYYNAAEALFWLGKYRQSLEAYRTFLVRFPSHDHAAYSMTRIGELLEILGANEKRVMGAFMEAAFRYGNSPGANVAVIRLTSKRMDQMKENKMEQELNRVWELVKGSPLKKIKEFASVMVADGFMNRKAYDRSVKVLSEYYQRNPTTANFEVIADRIVRNINLKFRDEIEKKNFIEALDIYEKHADGWLKYSKRIDTRFFLGKAFELAGIFKEADKVYRETLNKLYAIKGTRKEKERNVFEELPSESAMNLRLAAVALQRGKHSKALSYLNQIKDIKNLKDEEKIERVEVASIVAEKQGKLNKAKKYLEDLAKTWKGVPAQVTPIYYRLAQLQEKTGDRLGAEASLTKVIALMADTGKINKKIHSKSLESLGDLYLKSKRPQNAAKTYRDLLNRYESKLPLSDVRYRLGKIFFDQGNIQKAAEEWKGLKGKQNDFWHKLTQEQMKGVEWKKDYSRYLNRIPAMEGMKK